MRKTKIVAIHEEGNRDNGKVFLITELPARKAEKWAARLLRHAISRMDLPSEIGRSGMAGIAMLGMRGILYALADMPWNELEGLMDEMLECVAITPDAKNPQVVRPLIDDDTEEVGTLVRLRQDWIELHTGFSLTDAPSTSGQATSAQAA